MPPQATASSHTPSKPKSSFVPQSPSYHKTRSQKNDVFVDSGSLNHSLMQTLLSNKIVVVMPTR